MLMALNCGTAQATSLTVSDLNDGTIDVSTGQFEGGFTVNGALIAQADPARIGLWQHSRRCGKPWADYVFRNVD